jgi:hypothetical protein
MSGPASDGDSGAQQVSIAPCAQKQQRSAPAVDIAKTELGSSASSSRDGSCHGLEHQRGSGLLRSTSSRDLNDGVRAWENLHHPKFGEPLRPCDSLCNILTERWALHCASAHYLPFLVGPAAHWNQQCHPPCKQCSNRHLPENCLLIPYRLCRAIAGSGVQDLWHRSRSSVADRRQ